VQYYIRELLGATVVKLFVRSLPCLDPMESKYWKNAQLNQLIVLSSAGDVRIGPIVCHFGLLLHYALISYKIICDIKAIILRLN
jgi:hypothetical protein